MKRFHLDQLLRLRALRVARFGAELAAAQGDLLHAERALTRSGAEVIAARRRLDASRMRLFDGDGDAVQLHRHLAHQDALAAALDARSAARAADQTRVEAASASVLTRQADLRRARLRQETLQQIRKQCARRAVKERHRQDEVDASDRPVGNGGAS